jgi:4-amino-4-deoxy-L-arabinose transferase-like glycosyltransferase
MGAAPGDYTGNRIRFLTNISICVSSFRTHITDLVRPAPWAAILIVAFLVANIAGLLLVGVHPDEAYYWVWSQRLAWGYFDHPPGVAFLIRLFTSLLGNHPWALRLPAVTAWLVCGGVIYRMGRSIFPDARAAGLLSVLVFASLPIMQVGFHLVTPDAPQLLFTALAYQLVYRAVRLQRVDLWMYGGLAAGAALFSKYTGVLVPFAIFVALLLSTSGRRELRRPWPWIAGVLALLVFVPVIWWNYQHEWISFRFQLHHGIENKESSWLYNLAAYVVSQMGVAAPWTWIAMVVAGIQSRRWTRDEFGRALLLSGFAVPLLFFAVAGLTFAGGANWPVMAYVPGSVLLGGALAHWLYASSGAVRRTPVALVVLACVVALVLVNLLRYPLGAMHAGITFLPDNTQITHTYGWPKLGAAVREVYGKQRQQHDCRILVDLHTLAAEISLQLGDPRDVVVRPGKTTTQYTVWNDEGDYKNGSPYCVYIKYTYAPYSPTQFPASLTLPGSGQWRRVREVELIAPERPRWYGIYVPAP